MNKEDVITQINEAFDGVEQPQEIYERYWQQDDKI